MRSAPPSVTTKNAARLTVLIASPLPPPPVGKGGIKRGERYRKRVSCLHYFRPARLSRGGVLVLVVLVLVPLVLASAMLVLVLVMV